MLTKAELEKFKDQIELVMAIRCIDRETAEKLMYMTLHPVKKPFYRIVDDMDNWLRRMYSVIYQRHVKRWAEEKAIARESWLKIHCPTHCPVLNIELVYDLKANGDRDSKASVDRIDSTRGYTEGNVAIVSWKANRFKLNMSLQEARNLTNWMSEVQHGTTPSETRSDLPLEDS